MDSQTQAFPLRGFSVIDFDELTSSWNVDNAAVNLNACLTLKLPGVFMKAFFAISIFVLSFVGCERTIPIYEYECPEITLSERAGFILQCLKNANPVSDEDPEDWMEICEDISKRVYCQSVKGFRHWSMDASHFIPCTEAQTRQEKKVCHSPEK